jgi:hypothetical protein
MRKWLLPIFVLPFLSSKCEDNPKPSVACEGVLNMTIKPTLNSQPFVSNKVYVINGKKVRFSKFQFYLSSFSFKPIGLVSNAKSVGCDPIKDVIFMDFTQLDDSLKSLNGITKTLNNFENGNFESISFNLGLNTTLNAKTPPDFDTSNPLSKSEEYWSGWKSYIFFKLEGLMDKDGDGTFETGITYHTGSNDVTSPTNFLKNFDLKPNGTPINFDLDMNKLLTGFDFTTLNKIENLNQKDDMKKLMSNLVNAISIK